jgi:hypothetical protein
VEGNTPSIQLTLEELRNQLEDYRKNKSYNREPIPKEIWQAAADLAQKHSITTVSKALRLRYASLKEHIYGPPISKNKVKEKFPSFVELKYSQPLTSEEITVDIENKRGCRMRICLKESVDITKLVKSFCSL